MSRRSQQVDYSEKPTSLVEDSESEDSKDSKESEKSEPNQTDTKSNGSEIDIDDI